MAQQALAKFWLATKADLEDVLLHETLIQRFEPTKETRVVHEVLSELYCRYVHLCRMLDRCYDQTLQVQKREVVQILAESANRRMLELQQKVKQMELSEFTYIDGALRERHLIPQDVKVVRPCFFPLERSEELKTLTASQSLEPLTSSSGSELSSSEESEEEPPPDPRRPVVRRDRPKEKRMAALSLILAHEKARQARIMQYNFKAHPKIFFAKPREDAILDFEYEFYHRPDQYMLIPVKRTVFNWDYRLKEKNVVAFPYYRPPGWVDDEPVESKPKFTAVSKPSMVEEEEEEEDNTEELIEQMINSRAARRIQWGWRKYKERKRAIRERYNRSVYLGMIDEMQRGPDLNARIDQAEAERKKRKMEFDEAFIQAIQDEKARILQQRGPWIMEDITEHIRAWFRDFYDLAHAFDRYPEIWEGGTLLVIRGETMTPDEYMEEQKRKALEKKKSAEQKKKEAEARKKLKEKEKEKKQAEKERLKELKREEKEREKAEGKTYDFKKPEFATNAYVTIQEAITKYEEDWYFIDELENKDELPIMEWITLDKFAEVHQELRPIVDELLRVERELLQKALCKDSKKKYKPAKPKKEKKKKGKGKGKGKKKKEAPDLTADRTTESLYEELIEKDVIKAYKKRSIDDFIGDYNYAAYERRNFLDQDPPAAMGEVRDIIRSWLFGMGPLEIPKPKSFCLLGPPGYGKMMLVEAVCTETESVLFDLSVEVVAGIAPAEMTLFLHMILKMARILQPTVICIKDAHKIFYKKVPPEEKDLDPTKLSKHLMKHLLKKIKKDERILLVGTSSQPWAAKMGKFKKCFEKFLIVPKTDYGTTQLLWRHALSKKVGISKDFELSPLSMVTKGYSPKQIFDCVNRTLTIRRRMRLVREPLTPEELLEYFLQSYPPEYPIADKDYDKFTKFYRKADKLAKQRAKMIKAREEALAKLKAKAGKKK